MKIRKHINDYDAGSVFSVTHEVVHEGDGYEIVLAHPHEVFPCCISCGKHRGVRHGILQPFYGRKNLQKALVFELPHGRKIGFTQRNKGIRRWYRYVAMCDFCLHRLYHGEGMLRILKILSPIIMEIDRANNPHGRWGERAGIAYEDAEDLFDKSRERLRRAGVIKFWRRELHRKDILPGGWYYERLHGHPIVVGVSAEAEGDPGKAGRDDQEVQSSAERSARGEEKSPERDDAGA